MERAFVLTCDSAEGFFLCFHSAVGWMLWKTADKGRPEDLDSKLSPGVGHSTPVEEIPAKFMNIPGLHDSIQYRSCQTLLENHS